jgi:hypothetical protein
MGVTDSGQGGGFAFSQTSLMGWPSAVSAPMAGRRRAPRDPGLRSAAHRTGPLRPPTGRQKASSLLWPGR